MAEIKKIADAKEAKKIEDQKKSELISKTQEYKAHIEIFLLSKPDPDAIIKEFQAGLLMLRRDKDTNTREIQQIQWVLEKHILDARGIKSKIPVKPRFFSRIPVTINGLALDAKTGMLYDPRFDPNEMLSRAVPDALKKLDTRW